MATVFSFLGTALSLVLVLLVASGVFRLQAFTENYSYLGEISERDNAAVLIRLSGLLIAMFVTFIGTYQVYEGFLDTALYGGLSFLVGLAAVLASRYVNDYFILDVVDNNEAVVDQNNVAVAVVECSTYIATAIVFYAGMADDDGGFVRNLIWFVLGQALLVALAKLYKYVEPAIFENIEAGNVACALAFSGTVLAAGLAIGAAINGDFEGWGVDTLRVLLSVAVWLALMALARFVTSFVILSKERIVHEIVVDRNWAMGFMYGVIPLVFTIAFVFIHAS